MKEISDNTAATNLDRLRMLITSLGMDNHVQPHDLGMRYHYWSLKLVGLTKESMVIEDETHLKVT
jgi:hypothetical protein